MLVTVGFISTVGNTAVGVVGTLGVVVGIVGGGSLDLHPISNKRIIANSNIII